MWRFAGGVTDLSSACERALEMCQHGVISRTAAQRCGLTDCEIARLLRTHQWRRLFRGTYLVNAYQVSEISRATWMQAALTAHGPTACLVGPTAAEVHGFQGVPLSPDVMWIGMTPSTSRHRRQAPAHLTASCVGDDRQIQIRTRQLCVGTGETTLVQGLRVTRPLRTLVDAALDLDRAHALSVIDSALNLGAVTLDEVTTEVTTCRGRPGVRALRGVLPLVDARAQSPLETRIRLACIDGGVPPDDLQFPVRDQWGTLLGLADLAWWRGLRRPLIVEADGAGPHSVPYALFRDRYRANDFTLADVDMLRFTWPDAIRRYYVSGTVRRALARAAA
jgi:hypothetical protein